MPLLTLYYRIRVIIEWIDFRNSEGAGVTESMTNRRVTQRNMYIWNMHQSWRVHSRNIDIRIPSSSREDEF